jgi:hypothetical protein
MVIELLREGIGKARDAAVCHAHREIGALDMRRADMHRIGIAFDPRLGRARADS